MPRTADQLQPARSYIAPHDLAHTKQARIDSGRLLLRVLIGMLMLLHGLAKLRGELGQVMGMLTQNGLPGLLAYGVYVGEVVAPLLLIAGFWTRAAAWVVAVNMLVAIGLAHHAQSFSLNQQGGWAIELQAMYLLGAISVALIGAGPYSVGGVAGRWN